MNQNQVNSVNTDEEINAAGTNAAAEVHPASESTETQEITPGEASSPDTADTKTTADESDSNTVSFPDFPDRTDEAAAAALYAALNKTAPDADKPTAQPLFDGIDSEEYDGDDPETNDAASASAKVLPVKQKKQRRWPLIILICVVAAALCYSLAAFVPSGPIANLRNAYIQTAMSTADHQWLATWLFPKWVIDRAWTDPNIKPPNAPDGSELLDPVTTDTSVPDNTEPLTPDTEVVTEDTTAPADTETTEVSGTETVIPADDILGLTSLKIGDTDYAGNTVIEVNQKEGLFISEFTGKSTLIPGTKYHGYVMLIDDPSRVYVGTTPEKKTTGYRILSMMEYYGNTIAGINASGFSDPNDSGTGNDIIGACMSQGQPWGYFTNTMASIVLTKENKLVVGWMNDWSTYTNIRDGMQFGPVLVYKGKNQVDEATGGGMGVQPRTAIGQREDGVIIMIVIDGRVTSSIGCTMWEMADMMMKYGAVTAGGCDGGSSVVLAYDGKILNENSSANPTHGRRIPNAFLVRSKEEN